MQFAAEFFGTFVFLSVILHATSPKNQWPNLAPLLIIFGLLAGIVVSASGSGAHLNPAVSFMTYINGSMPLSTVGQYVSAQLLGAVAAVAVKAVMDGYK